MKQTFNIKRFTPFMGKELREQRKFLILSICAIFGIIALFSFFVFSTLSWNDYIYDNINDSERYERTVNSFSVGYFVFYLIGLTIIGCICQSFAFSNIHTKGKGTYYLMQPVSMFEKFLSKMLINVLFFYTIYTALFFFTKIFSDAYIVTKLPWLAGAKFPVFYDVKNALMWLSGIFTLHAIFLAGSTTFKRFNFLICTIIVGVFCFIVSYYLRGLNTFISPCATITTTIFNDSFIYKNTHLEGANDLILYIIKTEKSIETMLFRVIVFGIFTPLLYVYAWFRFKEKQV